MLPDASQHTLQELVYGGGEFGFRFCEHSSADAWRMIVFWRKRPACAEVGVAEIFRKCGGVIVNGPTGGAVLCYACVIVVFTSRNISDTYIYKAQFAKRNNTLQYDLRKLMMLTVVKLWSLTILCTAIYKPQQYWRDKIAAVYNTLHRNLRFLMLL